MTISPIREWNPAISSLLENSGLFESSDETDYVVSQLKSHLAKKKEDQSSDELWYQDVVVDDDDDKDTTICGVLYAAPEELAPDVWNLKMIVYAAEHRNQGLGSRALAGLETKLKAMDAVRLLLVETAESMEQSNAFYLKNGFEREGRIRDYYAPGEDKIIFRKSLV